VASTTPPASARRPYAPRLPAAERREQLVEAALDIALARGFHAVSVDAVARACGVTRPVVYGLFEDRTALLTALADRAEERSLAQLAGVFPALEDLPTDADPDELLVAGVTAYLSAVAEDPRTWRVVLLPPEGAPAEIAGRVDQHRRVLLRQLRAGETLGAVTYLLTDKTGTLTVNRLTLQEVVGDRGQVLAAARAAVPDDAATSADPVARELARAAGQLDLPPPGREVAVVPFDPVDKLAARMRATPGGPAAAVLGAPEAVLDRCQPGPVPAELADRAADLAATGARVLAVARRRVPPPAAGDPAAARDAVLSDLEPVGLVAFTDPLRPGVPEAAATLHRAGVAVVVVTGDHPQTATAVARAAGLPQHEEMPADEVERIHGELQGIGPAMRSPGVFGPEVPVPDDASAQDRFLGFIGRRP